MQWILEILDGPDLPYHISMIAPLVGAAIASGVGALGSQIIGGMQRRRQFGKQRQFNRQMADLAFKRNIEMWRMQNEYNHPAKQMMRFKEAGLNPNLVYGQGTPGNAQQMVQYVGPQQPVDTQPLVDPQKAVEAAYNILQSHQATRKMKADAEVTMWNTATARFRAAITQRNSIIKEHELNIIEENLDQWNESQKAEWLRKVSEATIAKYKGQLAKIKTESVQPLIRALAGLAEYYGLQGVAEQLNGMLIK